MYLKGRNLHGTYTNLIQENANFLKREKPLVSCSDKVLFPKLIGVNFFQFRITFEFSKEKWTKKKWFTLPLYNWGQSLRNEKAYNQPSFKLVRAPLPRLALALRLFQFVIYFKLRTRQIESLLYIHFGIYFVIFCMLLVINKIRGFSFSLEMSLW